MKLIISFSDGRLGNQIFMALFLQKLTNSGFFALIIGSNQIQRVFDLKMPKIYFKRDFKGAWRIRMLLGWLADFRIIGSITQNTKPYLNGSIEYCKGFSIKSGILGIYYVRGFFLSNSFINESDVGLLSVKKEHLTNAKCILQREVPQDFVPVFVHIRRGDYLNFSFNGLPAGAGILPTAYYKYALSIIDKIYKKPCYIFLSDDVDYVENEFLNIQNKYISKNSMEIDFALMVLASGGGITANSTFSYWGGYINKITWRSEVIGPKNNLGYLYDIEIPEGITCDEFTYISANDQLH